MWNNTFTNRLENNMVYRISWTTQLWANQNSFKCSSLVTTCASAQLLLFKRKTNSLLTALFNAIVLKRILLRILIMANKYSRQNWHKRKSPDNREIRIIEVQIIEVRLYWTVTSLQWRLMWWTIIKKGLMSFAFEKTPSISLHCKLVPVQCREYEYGLLYYSITNVHHNM